MRTLTVAAASLNQTPLDWTGNLRRICEAIEFARDQQAQLLCLPELALSGYGCEDQFLAKATTTESLEGLLQLVPETKNLIVAVGLPLRHQNRVFNSVALIANGELIGFYAKQNLAGNGIHYEPRWFTSWPEGEQSTISINDQDIPIGDLLFQVGDLRIAFEVCEDAWVANRPGRKSPLLGADIILNPSASHFAFGKQKIRRQFVTEGSRAFATAYVYANLLGNEAGRVIYDGGNLIANNGALVVEGSRFSFKEVIVTACTIDLELNRLAQCTPNKGEPLFHDIPLACSSFQTAPNNLPLSAHEKVDDLSKEEAFTRAVTLGLFDYMRKSRSRGFIISLSGGADSAACACLVALMLKLAHKELGPKTLRTRFFYLENNSANFTISKLLTCIYQASEQSGETTRQAAEKLANALSCSYDEWQISDLIAQYENLLENHLQRSLTWEQDDIARQNIQARVRAPGIWMLANIRQALLLTTSNRSEAAVGYATMDGDTCGGLAPIGGIDKNFLRQWLSWLETSDNPSIPAIPELKYINAQQPTAELRPEEQAQTDESDIMPYPILDQIEKWAIRDKRSPKEILTLLTHQFPEKSDKKLLAWVVRFFQLWSRNQWKRERYAPSFHLDDENLDPKTWCRFPILSGGFEDELSELKQMKQTPKFEALRKMSWEDSDSANSSSW